MESRYSRSSECISRLVLEWVKYDRIIIAVDKDSTIFDYHKNGDTYNDVISLINDCRDMGAFIIINTAVEDSKLDEVKYQLESIGIQYDLINENAPFVPFNTRKIYYNILLDDRAGLGEAMEILRTTVMIIRSLRNADAAKTKPIPMYW